MYYNRALIKEYYDVDSKKIPVHFQGKRIALLSDLHNHEFGKDNGRLIKMLQEEAPDYIMIAGDMIVKKENIPTAQMVQLFSKLRQIAPVYYAPGNHEDFHQNNPSFQKEYASFVQKIRKTGVTYLDNSCVVLEEQGQQMFVYGLHLEKKYFGKFYNRVKLEIHEIEGKIGKAKETYNILLAHTPVYFDAYAKWGADLVLSGHVHGGVVILPFLGGVISTSYELFPKYDFGKFVTGEKTMILSRGLAMHTIKLRVFNKPEISIIQLGTGKACEKKQMLVE